MSDIAPAPRLVQGPVLRRLGLGALWLGAGGIAATGQAPWGLWPLTLAAFALLYGRFRHPGGIWGTALMGWLAGTGYFMVALSWIVEPFLVDVARHGWMALPALVLLSAGMALYWGAAFALARLAGGGGAALVAAFTLGEAARGIFFTGFPWAQAGHVWIDTPMLHWATVAGGPGLTVLTLAAAVALWHLVAGRRLAGAAGLALVALLYAGGLVLTPAPVRPGDAPVVRVVQPNAAQHEKWDPAMIPVFFDRQLDYTMAGPVRPDLVVWPETSIPVALNEAAPALRTIAEVAGAVPVVAGLQRREGSRIYNSLVVIGEEGKVNALYDKHHLVPFGEFVPFGDLLARVGIAGIAARDGVGFSAGPGPQVIDAGAAGRALPLICYEGVFARNVSGAAERPDVLMMITNDAWFGKVSGPYQHLAQARLRSAEQGLPMIRAANTGISAMIDGTGRLVETLPLGEADWFDAPLPPPLPPTLYARIGDGPGLVLMILVLVANRWMRRPARPGPRRAG